MSKIGALALLGILAIVSSFPIRAEIVKVATPGCQKNEICFYWWPKLPDLSGWHSDQDENLSMGENGANVLIPDGKTFKGAPAIIYANAVYKERYDWKHKPSTLASFIEDDKATFRKRHKDIEIDELAPITTADGQTLKTFAYLLPSGKTSECVAYGEEDGYYLLFVLSADSEDAYRSTLPVFQALITRYKS